MSQTCSICRHPKRLEIEQALLSGTPLRDIQGRYGTARTSLSRHRPHVSEAVTRSSQARDVARTGALLDDVRAGERRAERLYAQAEEILAGALVDKDRRTALQAIRAAIDVMSEARSYMELRGELTGEIDKDSAPNVQIQIVTPWSPADAMPTIRYVREDGEFEAAGLFEELGVPSRVE